MNEVRDLNENKDTKIEIAHHIKTDYFGTDGYLKGILTAPVLYHYETDTPYISLPDGLRVTFFKEGRQNEVQSILTAQKGIYYEQNDKITVRDSVVLTTRDGKMLETSVLHWDPKKERFFTKKKVKLTTSSEVIYGENGLTAPPDFSWYRFNRASGNIQVDSSFTGE